MSFETQNFHDLDVNQQYSTPNANQLNPPYEFVYFNDQQPVDCIKNSSSQDDQENDSPYHENPKINSEQEDFDLNVESVDKKYFHQYKGNYCVFCGNRYAKICRHFEDAHENEEEVKEFMQLEKKSKERLVIQEKLRKRGNFRKNQERKEAGKGALMPDRRCRDDRMESQYIDCQYCKGLYLKKNLWIHERRCTLKDNSSTDISRNRQVLNGAQIARNPIASKFNSAFINNVVKSMKGDAVSELAQNDFLIMLFGQNLFEKLPQAHLREHIRQRMRQCAKLLQCAIKNEHGIKEMQQLIQPKNFDLIIQCVREICCYNEENSRFGISGLPLKLGHNLKRLAELKQTEAIKFSDEASKKSATDFLLLMNNSWSFKISSQALATSHERKFNKPDQIPLTRDIVKFNKYLNDKIDIHTHEIELRVEGAFRKLASVTLTSIMLFNRRRAGEAQRLTIENYVSGLNAERICEESENALSDFEKSVLKSVKRIEVRGKKGRKVPILLRANHKLAIDLLIERRSDFGVVDKNVYVFARNNFMSESPICGCTEMKINSESCNLEKPELVRGTKLRKHIATAAQLMDLEGIELEQLATFMGHDISVHKEYYRLPSDVHQITKISQILMRLEGEEFEDSSKGMSLFWVHMNFCDLIQWHSIISVFLFDFHLLKNCIFFR